MKKLFNCEHKNISNEHENSSNEKNCSNEHKNSSNEIVQMKKKIEMNWNIVLNEKT